MICRDCTAPVGHDWRYCDQHLQGVEVRPSRVHGLGLWTTRAFATDEVIAVYEAEQVNEAMLAERYGSNEDGEDEVQCTWTVTDSDGRIWDAMRLRPAAAYANDAHQTVFHNNASLTDELQIVALEPLPPFTEVLFDYGDAYW